MENSTEEVSSDNGIEKNSNRIDFGEVNLVKDKIILNKISDILERFENNSKSGNDIIARDKKSSDILNNIEKILFFYENREKNLSNVKSLKIYENRFLELSLDDDSIYIFDILIFDILEEDESKFFV
ncbi:MAG: hypothetical protein LBQ59_01285 [Candidatus Peribacteria bacterium]|jgi:hypothetical protein|nr:hypothetical protein [Candidatus Peribacteria bacterium]